MENQQAIIRVPKHNDLDEVHILNDFNKVSCYYYSYVNFGVQGLLDQEEHLKESLSDFGFQYNLIADKNEVFLQVSDHVLELRVVFI